jgi:hypothetical protein
MTRILKYLIPLLLLCGTCLGQGYNSYQVTTFTVAGTPPAVAAPGTAKPIYQNTTSQYHQISWTDSGTVSTCSVQVDSSPDNSTWTAGGIITSQSCTSAGNSAVVHASAVYIRVNVTVYSGSGSMTLTYKGYATNPSGGGGGSPGGASGTLQYNNSGAFGGVTGSSVDGSGDITLQTSLQVGVGGTLGGLTVYGAATGDVAEFFANYGGPVVDIGPDGQTTIEPLGGASNVLGQADLTVVGDGIGNDPLQVEDSVNNVVFAVNTPTPSTSGQLTAGVAGGTQQNTDICGSLGTSSGTSVEYDYTNPFTGVNPPIVLLTTTSGAATTVPLVTNLGSSGAWTGFTITGLAHSTFNYFVIGQP